MIDIAPFPEPPPMSAPDIIKALRFSVVFISPARARRILDASNGGNREMKRRIVERLSASLKTGDFRLVPDCLAFSPPEDGYRLISGQHRLTAVIETGVGAWFCVIVGFPYEETIERQGINTPWRFMDHLKTKGYSHPKSRAAILFHVWRWEEGRLSWGSAFDVSVTQREVMDLAARHDVTKAAGWMESMNRTHLGRAHSAFMHFITMKVNPTMAAPFWAAVHSGEGLVRGDPAYCLRERLIKAQNPVGRIDDRIALMFHIQAWNAHVRGERLYIHRETPTWPEIEGAPMPRVEPIPEVTTKKAGAKKPKKAPK